MLLHHQVSSISDEREGDNEEDLTTRLQQAPLRKFLLFLFLLFLVSSAIIAVIIIFNSPPQLFRSPLLYHWGIKENNNDYVIVSTSFGQVEGKRYNNITTDDGEVVLVYEFRNIPYAVPPIGNLRFKPPKALSCKQATCWNGTLKYNKHVVKCKQMQMNEPSGTEDCLVLTIRTPRLLTSNTPGKKNLPVLFWIHGGSLIERSNEHFGYFPDEQFTASINVVTVSVNYRLNIFGFLSVEELWIKSGTDESYGNYGTFDQILALKWLQENIINFGGDPNNIIIFGNSGGGKAVYNLLTSPLARGLFHKAISSSGYPSDVRGTYKLANERYRVFLKDINCNNTQAKLVLECLQNADADKITLHLPWYKHSEPNWWVFPNNERTNEIIVDVIGDVTHPETIGTSQKLSNEHIDILIGYVAQEGMPRVEANTWDGLDIFLKPRVRSFKEGVYEKIIEMYKEKRDDKISPDIITSQYVYTTMTSDVLMSCQTNEIARNLSRHSNVNLFRYVVSQPYTNNGKVTFHEQDMSAVFGNEALTSPTREDRILMINMRSIFGNFMHSKLSHAKFKEKTIEFWNSTVKVWDHYYHMEECKVWKSIGALKRAWGQLGE